MSDLDHIVHLFIFSYFKLTFLQFFQSLCQIDNQTDKMMRHRDTARSSGIRTSNPQYLRKVKSGGGGDEGWDLIIRNFILDG